MGAGDDRFIWDPGDGSDTIEGQAGSDALTFNGANVAEQFDVSANGGARAVLPQRREHHHGPRTTSSRSTSTRSAAPTS